MQIRRDALLTPEDAVLLLIQANGNRIDGRTSLQKLTYFTQLLIPLSRKLRFRPHFYGPYSAELAGLLDALVGIRLLGTEALRTFRERILYSYSLTQEAKSFVQPLLKQTEAKKIAQILETCKKETRLNPDVLSFAAKADYILRQKRKNYTSSQVIAEGKKLGWALSDKQVKDGVKVLLALGLAKKRKRIP